MTANKQFEGPLNCQVLPKDLERGLDAVQRAVGSNSVLDILDTVCFKTDSAKGGTLELYATNLSIGMRLPVPAKVLRTSAIAIPHRRVRELVSLLPPERADLSFDHQQMQLHIDCAGHNARIKSLDPNQYPRMPTIAEMRHEEGSVTIAFEPAVLESALRHTVFSVMRQQARESLSGVLMKKGDADDLIFASADGYRLSEQVVKDVTVPEGLAPIIIPRKTVLQMTRMLRNQREPVLMVVTRSSPGNSTGNLGLLVGRTELRSQLLSGEFPDYKPLLATEHTTRMKVDGAALKRVLEGALVFTKSWTKASRWEIEEGKLTLSGANTGVGSHISTVPCALGGEPLTFCLNAQFAVQALSALGVGEVTVSLNDRVSAVQFKSEKAENYVHIIMPMDMTGAPEVTYYNGGSQDDDDGV